MCRWWLCWLLVTPFALADEVVPTTAGPVSGRRDGALRAYLGVPYARPPLGQLRWRPPQPPEPWTTPRACTALPPSAPQLRQGLLAEDHPQSEDCLYLNVWTTAPEATARRPVLVWIHGGGFQQGSSNLSLYDGAKLAQRGLVVVSLNYRVGALGFLAHPALAAESPQGACGMYGLLDQIAALRWVHDNIAGFGGDPQCVTIAGQSAGGASVVLLLSSPLTTGLCHRAIAMSGAVAGPLPTAAAAQQAGLQFAQTCGIAAGPTALTQLRALPVERLLTASSDEPLLPGSSLAKHLCVDGLALRQQPFAVWAAGQQLAVPLLTGSSRDEGTSFMLRNPLGNLRGYQAQVQAAFGTLAPEARRLYPATDDATAKRAMEDALSDSFAAGCRAHGRWQSAVQLLVFRYFWTRTTRATEITGLRAFHGIDLPYFFGNPVKALRLTGAELALSDQVAQQWARFAATGDPNGPDLPTWPRYTAPGEQCLEIGTATRVVSDPRQAQCDLFDRARLQR